MAEFSKLIIYFQQRFIKTSTLNYHHYHRDWLDPVLKLNPIIDNDNDNHNNNLYNDNNYWPCVEVDPIKSTNATAARIREQFAAR